jgi:hypothetical protein
VKRKDNATGAYTVYGGPGFERTYSATHAVTGTTKYYAFAGGTVTMR